jgi:hypothetical protein
MNNTYHTQVKISKLLKLFTISTTCTLHLDLCYKQYQVQLLQ